MDAMSGMSIAELNERVAAVTRVHNVLNARNKYMPMPVQREVMWFVLGSFAVLGLLGFAALAA